MSKEEKAKEYADGIILNCQWDSSWNCEEIHLQLRDAYQEGYTQALTDLSTENAQLREALREILKSFDSDLSGLMRGKWEDLMNRREDSLNRAKQLLTDNTKEDEKDKV